MFLKPFSMSVLAWLVCPLAVSAAVTDYFQDFESLDRTDPNALINDGWLLFAAGINGDAQFGNFGAGPFGLPNDINNPNISVISDIASGGAPPAGNQGLTFFSDYNSPLHSDPNDPRDLVLSAFQERTIMAGDIGNRVEFTFLADANANPPTGDAITEAFLLTLDPNAGFAATNDLSFDTTNIIDGALVNGSLSLDLTDPALVGQILQFGFRNTASDFEGSAVDYDNVRLSVSSVAVPEPTSMATLAVVGIAGMVGRRRRRR